jgi:hypothetical protein
LPKYVVKANNDVLSHCRCEIALAANPAQMDCPWCGCGWLIPCLTCKRVFTFGRVVDHDNLHQLVLQDNAARGLKLNPSEVDGTIEWWELTLEAFPVGATVVYLDGSYFDVGDTDVAYDGWFASHDLKRLPHAEALIDPARLNGILGEKSYWLARELPDRE